MFPINVDDSGMISKAVYNKITKVCDEVRWSVFFKSCRLMLGMQQADFANSVGISQGYLSRIEAGEKIPGTDTRKRLMNLLNERVK